MARRFDVIGGRGDDAAKRRLAARGKPFLEQGFDPCHALRQARSVAGQASPTAAPLS